MLQLNAYMNIQIRVLAAQAQRQLAQVQAQTRGVGGAATAAAAQTGVLGTAMAAAAAKGAYLNRSLNPSRMIAYGSAAQWTGRQLQRNFTLPILLAGGAAAKFAMDNEAAMARVNKVYGDSTMAAKTKTNETKALAKAFRSLSDEFGVNQTEVLKVAGDWAAAGSSGLALAKSVKLTLQTMTLGEIESTEATRALIAIQAQYGQTIGELGAKHEGAAHQVTTLAETIGVLNTIENQTGIGLTGLIQSLEKSAGVARAAGIPIRELAAMTAALVPAAGSAQQAGNALKSMISGVIAPTSQAADVLKEMGIRLDEGSWKSKTAKERLETVALEFKKLGDGVSKNTKELDENGNATGRMISAQQAAASAVLFTRWQVSRGSILMRAFTDEFSYLKTAMNSTADVSRNAAGAIEEINIVMATSKQRLKTMGVILQNSMADVIQPIIPALIVLASYLARAGRAFSELSPFTQKFILAGLLLLATLGPLLIFFGSLITSLAVIGKYFIRPIGAVLSLGSAFMWLAKAPFRLIAGGILGVGKAFFGARAGITAWIAKMLAGNIVQRTLIGNMLVGWAIAKAAMLSSLATMARGMAVRMAAMVGINAASLAAMNAAWIAMMGRNLSASFGTTLLTMLAHTIINLGAMRTRWAAHFAFMKLTVLTNMRVALYAFTSAISGMALAAASGIVRAILPVIAGVQWMASGVAAGAARAMTFWLWHWGTVHAAALAGMVRVNGVFNRFYAIWLAAVATYGRRYLAIWHLMNQGLLALQRAFAPVALAITSAYHTATLALTNAYYRTMVAITRAGELLRGAAMIPGMTARALLEKSYNALILGYIRVRNALAAAYEAVGQAMRTAATRAGEAARLAVDKAGAALRFGFQVVWQNLRVGAALAGEVAMLAVTKTGAAARFAADKAFGLLTLAWQAIYLRLFYGMHMGMLARLRSLWLATMLFISSPRMMLAGVARIGGAFKALPGVLARIGPMLFRAITGPIGLAITAGVGLFYLFRDQLKQLWANIGTMMQGTAGIFSAPIGQIQIMWRNLSAQIHGAFNSLPSGVRNAMMAVVNIVKSAAMAVYELFSYLNPFARHSPSLVENVNGGMAAVGQTYAKAGKNANALASNIAGSMNKVRSSTAAMVAQANADAAAMSKAAANHGSAGKYSDERADVAKVMPAQLPRFDRLVSSLGPLNAALDASKARVDAQEASVDRWKASLDRANNAVDAGKTKLDGMQEKLSGLQELYDASKERSEAFASAPLKGMGLQQNAIFANELAQKKLQRQILMTGTATKTAVDAAERALDNEQRTLDRLTETFDGLKATMDAHKQSMDDYASAPIAGMGAMSDAIFENQMAQKRLRLEMMRMEDAGGSIDDVRKKLSALQGDIEKGQSEITDLRLSGAGSDITGPMMDNLAAMEAQRAALEKSVDNSGITALQKEIDALARAGERLDLENSIQFDPMTRQVEQLVNARKEMAFDDIVAGINREKEAIAALQPAYNAAETAVKGQEAAVKAADAVRLAAVASYEADRVAVEKLEVQLASLQQQNELMQLNYDIEFGPQTREIERLVAAQEELSFDAVVAGINKERDAMAVLQPQIDATTAAIKGQEAAVKALEVTRDGIQVNYDAEQAELDKVKQGYDAIAEAIQNVKQALSDVAGAASAQIQLEKEAKGRKEAVSPGLQAFRDAKGGAFADPGGNAQIGREGGIGDQSAAIEEFTKQSGKNVADTFSAISLTDPFKKKWEELKTWFTGFIAPFWNPLKDLFKLTVGSIDWGAPFDGLFQNDAVKGFGPKLRNVMAKGEDALKVVWNGMKMVFDLFAPAVRKIIEEIVKAWFKLVDSVGPEVAAFGELIKPLGEALKNYFGMVGGMLLYISSTILHIVSEVIGPVFDTLIGLISNAIQIIRGIVQVFVGVFTLDFEMLGKGVLNIFGGLFGAIGNIIMGAIKIVLGFIEGFVKGIVNFFKWLYDVMVGHSIIPDLVEKMIQVWNWLTAPFKAVIEGIKKFIYEILVPAFNWMLEKVTGAWEAILSGIETTWNAIKAVFTVIVDWVKRQLVEAFNFYRDAAVGAWNAIKDGVNAAWKIISGVFSTVLDWVKRQLSEAFVFYRDAAVGAWNKIKETTNTVWGWMVGIFGTVKTWLAETLTGAWNTLKDAGQGAWNGIKSTVNTVWSALVTTFGTIRDWASSTLSGAFDTLAAAVKKPFEWLRDNVGDIWGKATTKLKDGANIAIRAINKLIGGINKVASMVGLSLNIALIPELAQGGKIPAQRVGSGFVTNKARAIVGEGSNQHKEFVVPTDPRYRKRAQMLYAQLGSQLGVPAYAQGGVMEAKRERRLSRTKVGDTFVETMRDDSVRTRMTTVNNTVKRKRQEAGIPMLAIGDVIGKIGSGVKGAATSVAGTVKDAVDATTENVANAGAALRKGAVNTLFGPFKDAANKMLDQVPAQFVRAGGKRLVSDAVAWVAGESKKYDDLNVLSGGGFAKAGGPWAPGTGGGFAPNAAAAAAFVRETFGITNIGGYANRNIAGTNTKSDHATGKAIDVMIANYKTPAGVAQGNKVANHFVNNPAQFGTKYVIWKDQITTGSGWRKYQHPGGDNDTLQHRDHVHVSFLEQGGVIPKLATGGIVTRATNAIVGEAGPEAVLPLNNFYQKLDEGLVSIVAAVRSLDANQATRFANFENVWNLDRTTQISVDTTRYNESKTAAATESALRTTEHAAVLATLTTLGASVDAVGASVTAGVTAVTDALSTGFASVTQVVSEGPQKISDTVTGLVASINANTAAVSAAAAKAAEDAQRLVDAQNAAAQASRDAAATAAQTAQAAVNSPAGQAAVAAAPTAPTSTPSAASAPAAAPAASGTDAATQRLLASLAKAPLPRETAANNRLIQNTPWSQLTDRQKLYADTYGLTLTKLAVGGIATRATRAIVGEAGPEAVLPLGAFYSNLDRGFGSVVASVHELIEFMERQPEKKDVDVVLTNAPIITTTIQINNPKPTLADLISAIPEHQWSDEQRRYADQHGISGARLMATGGIVTAATNAIVGEAGPEAVLPLAQFYNNMNEGFVGIAASVNLLNASEALRHADWTTLWANRNATRDGIEATERSEDRSAKMTRYAEELSWRTTLATNLPVWFTGLGEVFTTQIALLPPALTLIDASVKQVGVDVTAAVAKLVTSVDANTAATKELASAQQAAAQAAQAAAAAQSAAAAQAASDAQRIIDSNASTAASIAAGQQAVATAGPAPSPAQAAAVAQAAPSAPTPAQAATTAVATATRALNLGTTPLPKRTAANDRLIQNTPWSQLTDRQKLYADNNGLTITKMAAGGIVRPSPGGTLALLGERGYSEAVIPLDNRNTGRGDYSTGGTTVIEINGNLSFPNITSGNDAEAFIRNLESMSD